MSQLVKLKAEEAERTVALVSIAALSPVATTATPRLTPPQPRPRPQTYCSRCNLCRADPQKLPRSWRAVAALPASGRMSSTSATDAGDALATGGSATCSAADVPHAIMEVQTDGADDRRGGGPTRIARFCGYVPAPLPSPLPSPSSSLGGATRGGSDGAMRVDGKRQRREGGSEGGGGGGGASGDSHEAHRQTAHQGAHQGTQQNTGRTDETDDNDAHDALSRARYGRALQAASASFSGACVVHDFVSAEYEQALVDELRAPAREWKPSQSGRRKQDYGPKVNATR